MITALLERWKRELAAVPPYLSWTAQCAPQVLATYLRCKRGLVTRGIPLIVACLLVQGLIERAQLLPAGNPLSVSLYLVCLGTLGWPPAYQLLGVAFWQAARLPPAAHSARLRLCAVVFFGIAAIATLCLIVLSAVVIYAWGRFAASL